MNRQKELAKNTMILTIGKICTQFVSFLLLPLYTALLSPEQYGVVDLFNTYVMLFTPLFNWQLENGLFRFLIDYRENKDKQKSLFTSVVLTNVLQSILYIIFYAIMQGYITSEYKIFLAIDVVLNIMLNTLLQFPRGVGKNGVYSFGSFLSATTTVCLNVIFIAVFRWGAYGLFIATVLAKTFTCIYLCFAMKVWEYFSPKLASLTFMKDVLKYSIPLVPNQLSWWVVGVSDRAIVSHIVGIAANGVYSVANKFSTVYVTFYNIFNMSWTESVSLHMNDEDRDVFLTDIINTMFKLFASVAMGIVACMPFVFDILINKQYADAYYQIPILMIAVLFQVVVGLYSVIYVALKKTGEIAKTSLLAALINVTTNLLLISRLGLYAASLSTLFAYGAMALYRYFDVRRFVNVRLDRASLVSTCMVGIITCLSYYSKSFIWCGISLVVVIMYAYVMNRKFLKSILKELMSRIVSRSK